MLFLVSICTSFHRGSQCDCTVPGGCCCQGCHGYLLGSLAAPFCFIRHLPHTHLLNFDGFKSYFKTVRVNLYGAVKPELDILEAFGISCVKPPYFFVSSCNLIYLVWFSPCGSEGLVISSGKGGEKWQQACKKRKTEKNFCNKEYNNIIEVSYNFGRFHYFYCNPCFRQISRIEEAANLNSVGNHSRKVIQASGLMCSSFMAVQSNN